MLVLAGGKIEQRPVGVEDTDTHAGQRSIAHAHHLLNAFAVIETSPLGKRIFERA